MDENPATEQPGWQLRAPEIGPEVNMPEKLSQLRQKLHWKAKQEPKLALVKKVVFESRIMTPSRNEIETSR